MPQLSKRGYRGFFLKKPKSPCLKTAPGSGLEDGHQCSTPEKGEKE